MQTILNFLNDLKQHNNRDWFQDNKQRYEEAKTIFFGLTDILIAKIKEFDSSVDVNSAKECAFRIYKDVRFSKDKTPYKTNMGAYISKGGRKSTHAGYYIHIEPGASFAGGGMYCPQTDVLKTLRQSIAEDATPLRSILSKPAFKTVFPELSGETLKTAPRGFDKNHPDIDLLRFKSYTVIKHLTDTELISKQFLDNTLTVFKTQKPFNDYLNQIIK